MIAYQPEGDATTRPLRPGPQWLNSEGKRDSASLRLHRLPLALGKA